MFGYSPYATCDAPGMVNTNELVAGGSDVKVGLLLVHEERIRHPDVLDELGADAERLDAFLLREGEPWVRPELSKVKIQRKVLTIDTKFSLIQKSPVRSFARRRNEDFISGR